jgi:hypothetical protein
MMRKAELANVKKKLSRYSRYFWYTSIRVEIYYYF